MNGDRVRDFPVFQEFSGLNPAFSGGLSDRVRFDKGKFMPDERGSVNSCELGRKSAESCEGDLRQTKYGKGRAAKLSGSVTKILQLREDGVTAVVYV